MSKCIICQTNEELAFKKHKYEIKNCPNCNLFRTVLPQKYDQLLKTYYSKAYFTGSETRAGYADYLSDQQATRLNARNYLKLINRFKSKGKLLDVGCATGIFLEEAMHTYQAQGIDPSAYAISQAKKKFKHRVRRGSLTSSRFKQESFDVITLLDVFEHLDNPRKSLKKIRYMLKPGGIIVINTGDANSLLAKIQKENWHYFIPPQHLYFFSKSNLLTLLQSENFEPIYTNSQGKHLTLRYLLHLMRTINKSKAANWLYQKTHKNFLGKIPLYINLFDNMTIIAKKE